MQLIIPKDDSDFASLSLHESKGLTTRGCYYALDVVSLWYVILFSFYRTLCSSGLESLV